MDTAVAAHQNLHLIKQCENKTIEAFLQRVMTVATDGYGIADKLTLQNVATESLLSL